MSIKVRTIMKVLLLLFVRTKIRKMKDDIKKVGRPTKQVKASARCEFRVEPERKEHYQKHAKNQGLKLGAWLKELADKDSGIDE